MIEIELRCPIGPKRLFSRVIQSGKKPSVVEGNLIEFACPDCKKTLRKKGQTVFRVLHRYDLTGELISSYIQEESSR